MAPLRANLAACSVVAGSMSAACANTPASVADLQAVTGLSALFCFCFFLLWMRSEARAARRSGMTCALRDGRAPLGGKRFAILCKHLRRRSTHAACGREELRGVSPRTEHESVPTAARNSGVIPPCTGDCGWKLAKRLKLQSIFTLESDMVSDK